MKKPPSTRRLGISAITVSGFKSLSRPTRIELRPLTILAGANSPGKSSIVQPLLLLKQTLEATYDPGGLRPHVEKTLFDDPLIAEMRTHVEFSAVALKIRKPRPLTR